jgi:hypothetical protein
MGLWGMTEVSCGSARSSVANRTSRHPRIGYGDEVKDYETHPQCEFVSEMTIKGIIILNNDYIPKLHTFQYPNPPPLCLGLHHRTN